MLQSSTGSIHAFEVATKSEIFVLPFHYFGNRVSQCVCPHVQQVCPNVRPTHSFAQASMSAMTSMSDLVIDLGRIVPIEDPRSMFDDRLHLPNVELAHLMHHLTAVATRGSPS